MVEARVRRIGMRELGIVFAILGVGWTLRWWHLNTPSLWWDELVEISFARAPDPWSVFGAVQRGVPPGSGNAGAVPLDYVLLHLWTTWIPRPPVEEMEAYFRFPSYVWSCVTLPVFWAYVRGTFGRVAALAATLLLALSIPHVLYAAEARFYSLLILMSVLNLATFTRVVRHPDEPRAWVAYAGVNVLFFLTGMLTLLVLPWQFVALGLAAVRRRSGAAAVRQLGALAATLAVVATVLGSYYLTADLGSHAGRAGASLLTARQVAEQALDFLTVSRRSELWMFGWGAVASVWYVLRRRRDLVPVVATILASTVTTLPVLVELLRWKRYYFHPRHVLFLLPGLDLLAAVGLVVTLAAVVGWVPVACRPATRRRVVATLALVSVVAIWGPDVPRFLAHPQFYFVRIKSDRDMKGLVRDLASRVSFYGPGEKYLLVVDRIGPGYLANPTLAWYLQRYSIDSRVVIRSTTAMLGITEELAQGCGGPCRGLDGAEVQRKLLLGPSFETAHAKLRFLGVPRLFGSWPGTVRDLGALYYTSSNRRLQLAGTTVRLYTGMILSEPR